MIGREDDLATVCRLLATNRVVTLTAVGGSGKTRLAIAVGELELPRRSGGVWFVDLTAVMSGSDLPAAVANAVGLALGSGDPTEQVLSYLARSDALVILDNCEHLIDDCADFVERALAAEGSTAFLTTSRELLDVEGERTVVLGTLPCASADSAGVQLFLDRATALDPRFELTADNTETIAMLCTRLDGMPLAIELAAARITVMTPTELLAGLDDRFQLLAGGRRRQRQRTLEATLDWSYDLLDDEEQRVFRSLGVFVDGFDLDAVAAVAGLSRAAAVSVVEALVAKSLVVRADRGQTARFGMLETLKAYAEDRLVDTGEAARVRDAHLAHFHRLANVHGRKMGGEVRLGVRLRNDRSNISTAFEWAASTDQWITAGELVVGARAAFDVMGHAVEIKGLLERAIDHCADIDPDLVDWMEYGRSAPFAMLSNWAAFSRGLVALSRCASAPLRAGGVIGQAWLAAHARPDAAPALLIQAQSLADEARHAEPGPVVDLMTSWLLHARALHAAYAGDLARAVHLSQESLALDTAIDFMPTSRVEGVLRLAAACQTLIGEPRQALITIAELDDYDLAFYDGADMRALAYLELGDINQAIRYIRLHAARGATGRYHGEANDSVMMIAALARVEDDVATAQQLLLNSGFCRTDGTIIYSRELARRLGIAGEHEQRQRQAAAYGSRSAEGINGFRLAMATLQTELARRGWD